MQTQAPTLFLLAFSATLSVTACRNPLPCPDCADGADVAEDGEEEAPPLDLPCGGADLMTDNLNCGVCGNECAVWYEGTQWEAGGCVEGQCGPGYTDCIQEASNKETCAEICEFYGGSCSAQGCGGQTALLLNIQPFGDCTVDFVVQTMSGSCDEPIQWTWMEGDPLRVMCCCQF